MSLGRCVFFQKNPNKTELRFGIGLCNPSSGRQSTWFYVSHFLVVGIPVFKQQTATIFHKLREKNHNSPCQNMPFNINVFHFLPLLETTWETAVAVHFHPLETPKNQPATVAFKKWYFPRVFQASKRRRFGKPWELGWFISMPGRWPTRKPMENHHLLMPFGYLEFMLFSSLFVSRKTLVKQKFWQKFRNEWGSVFGICLHIFHAFHGFLVITGSIWKFNISP